MKLLNLSSLCDREYIENRENAKNCVAMLSDVNEKTYLDFCAALLREGFEKKEEYENDGHRFCAFSKDRFGVFVNLFLTVCEMYVVEEEDSLYFSYHDRAGEMALTPQITQVSLEDFGMSYVIRLSDGRFIVIDGGRELQPDCDRLFQVLKKGSDNSKPIIAAWIMTHPHSDHFHCFIPFMDQHADDVIVEKMMLLFPEANDLDHYPKLSCRDKRFVDSSALTNIPLMYERIEKTGAPIYTVHTGQTYQIGDAACTVLASMDDTIHLSDNINSTSLVIRMELGGQVILWASDACFEHVKLADRYGQNLKADILQIPHHGFGNGSAEEQIKGFEWIKPSVCLLPVSDYNAYTMFSAYRLGTEHLMHKMPCVKEVITGTAQRTLDLPYIAPDYAKEELERKFWAGRANCGSCTWVFSDLSTDVDEDFVFTLLNMTNFQASVSIDIFFEDRGRNLRYIMTNVEGNSLRKICVIGDEVDGDAVYFNWMSLKERGVPEHATFAIRFMSDKPIVVSHQKHAPAYHTTVY